MKKNNSEPDNYLQRRGWGNVNSSADEGRDLLAFASAIG